jgi:hypothetical protein
MKNICLIGLFLTIFACAPIRVNYDFDREINFSKYKTYNYFSDMNTGLSELDTKRFLETLDAKLATLGITFSETPNFYIDITSRTVQSAQQSSIGLGVGGTGSNVGGGVSMGIPIGQSNLNRQLTIEFVDTTNKRLFWQAISESSYSEKATPQVREDEIKQLIDKIFAVYPPKK